AWRRRPVGGWCLPLPDRPWPVLPPLVRPGSDALWGGESKKRAERAGRDSRALLVARAPQPRHPACEGCTDALVGRTAVGRSRAMQYAGAAVPMAVSLLAGSAAAAAQQMDSATLAAVEAAGAAVESVRMDPAALELAVGDTAEFTIRFLDGAGHEVQARLPDGRATPPAYMLLSGSVAATAMAGATLRVVGTRAGGGPTRVAVIRPPFPRSPQDRARYDEVPLPITVTSAPTARVELSEPAYGAYAGTSLDLDARVWLSGAGYPETEPVVRWSSSDRGVALVDDDGVVTFVAPGTVAIAAEHGGVRAERRFAVRPNPAASVTLAPAVREARTGDVVDLEAVVKDAAGRVVDDVRVTYGVSSGVGGPSAAANAAI